MTPLRFEYDAAADVLSVEGVKYAGDLFRGLGLSTAIGTAVMIEKREDGFVILRSVLIGPHPPYRYTGELT